MLSPALQGVRRELCGRDAGGGRARPPEDDRSPQALRGLQPGARCPARSPACFRLLLSAKTVAAAYSCSWHGCCRRPAAATTSRTSAPSTSSTPTSAPHTAAALPEPALPLLPQRSAGHCCCTPSAELWDRQSAERPEPLVGDARPQLPQYKIAFDAGASGAMCSYNSPLGRPRSHEPPLITTAMRTLSLQPIFIVSMQLLSPLSCSSCLQRCR